jgi:hypothetical protein
MMGRGFDLSRYYRTFSLRQPVGDQFRIVDCETFGCRWWRDGFKVRVDLATRIGQERAVYLRSGVHRRRYSEDRPPGLPTIVMFRFPAGTPCFEQHRVLLERPHFHLIRPGMPGRPRGNARQVGPDQWHDELGENQAKLLELQQRGW